MTIINYHCVFLVVVVVIVAGFVVWILSGRRGPIATLDLPSLGNFEEKAAKEAASIAQRQEKATQDAKTQYEKEADQGKIKQRETSEEIERLYRNGTNQERVKHLLKDDDLLN